MSHVKIMQPIESGPWMKFQEEYLTSVETSSRRSKRGHKTPEPQSPDVEAAKARCLLCFAKIGRDTF